MYFSIILVSKKLESLASKIEVLESDKIAKDERIKTLVTEIQSLETDKASMDGRLRKMENKPYAFQCAYRNSWGSANSDEMTWEKFITDTVSGVTGGFSLSTGQFTVGHSGVWQVSYSVTFWLDTGEKALAYLYINGRRLTESRSWASYNNSVGDVGSLGSRTLFINLDKGDEVTLQTYQPNGNALYWNTLCFHLVQPF